MLISIGVAAYNEEKNLPRLLRDLCAQDYPKDKIELIFADGCSQDGTRALLESFAREENGFRNIIILENKRIWQASAHNLIIKNFTGDALIKVDAHASLPNDFISSCARRLEREKVCGGPRPCITDSDALNKRLLLMAESSMFGSGFAIYRRAEKPGYVGSVFHIACRREVFEKAGGYNETLRRTEDNEFSYRLRQNGYKICYDPQIRSYQLVRPTLGRMLKQKAGNGYWIGLTLGVCPGCVSIFHLVPAAFVLGIIFTAVLAALGVIWPILAMWGVYLAVNILMSVMALRGKPFYPLALCLPLLFLLLHVSYGAGTLCGIVSIPFRAGKCLRCGTAREVKEALEKKDG